MRWLNLLLIAPLCGLLPAGCSARWSAGDDDDASFPADDDDSSPTDDDDDDDDDVPSECDDVPGVDTVPIDEGCTIESPIETTPDLQIDWQFSDFDTSPSFREVMMTPIVVPLTDDDGDGVPSDGDQRAILFNTFSGTDYSNNGVLRALRGDGSALLWSVEDPAWQTQPDSALAAADISGDAWPEIIAVSEDFHLMAFDRFGAPLWKSTAEVPSERGGVFVADLEGDGVLDLIYGNQIYDVAGNLMYSGTAGIGSNASRTEFPTSFAADIDLDGVQEVVVGNALYRPDGTSIWANGEPDGFPAVGNFDADPAGEIVVVFSNQVRIQDDDGTVIHGPVTLPGSGSGGPPTVADFDGDGAPEIGVANLSYYTLLDGNLDILWSNPTQDESSSITGSSSFDFDGDGASEIVYADEFDVWIWDGLTGDTIHQGSGHASGTHLEYPLVVQLEPEGAPRIVVGSNNLSSEGWNGITVLTDSGRSWVPTRRVWNQHAFMPTHIADDLSVPASPDMPWQVGLGFRENEVTVAPGLAVPDLSLQLHALCTEQCPERITARLRPLNVGVSAGGYTVSIVSELGGPELASVSVAGGQPASTLGGVLEFDLDASYAGQTVHAVIDSVNVADGGQVEECREGNNTLELTLPTCP